jgi:uncharacterized protein (DUF1697 family)
MKNHKFIAFLRGINVGGKKKVPMTDLKICLEKAGFTDVRTLLNTGNVVFDPPAGGSIDSQTLVENIEKTLETRFGFHIDTIVKTVNEIENLVKQDPFKDVLVTKDTRLYVTFVKGDINSDLKTPYLSPNKNFQIISLNKSVVFSVLTVTRKTGTTDGMETLEKEYGKQITTRNWNTVVRIARI